MVRLLLKLAIFHIIKGVNTKCVDMGQKAFNSKQMLGKGNPEIPVKINTSADNCMHRARTALYKCNCYCS